MKQKNNHNLSEAVRCRNVEIIVHDGEDGKLPVILATLIFHSN